MGAEVQNAQLSPRALELNLTNEGGVDGSYRLLKNIMGLWLAQGCKRSFEAKGKTFSYDELARLAHEARPLRSLVNANDSRFLNPPDMVQAIQDFCRETNQPVPETEAQLIRCAYDSLALAYRATLTYVEELTGHAAKTIHIVGGGSQSEILNQLTAAACKRPVLAGPVEATAMGNLLIQARADGEVSSLEDIRKVVCASCELEQTEPGEAGPWDAAAERYAALCG
jgi:rhamnulokinase